MAPNYTGLYQGMNALSSGLQGYTDATMHRKMLESERAKMTQEQDYRSKMMEMQSQHDKTEHMIIARMMGMTGDEFEALKTGQPAGGNTYWSHGAGYQPPAAGAPATTSANQFDQAPGGGQYPQFETEGDPYNPVGRGGY
jgi:hypothetical protein